MRYHRSVVVGAFLMAAISFQKQSFGQGIPTVTLTTQLSESTIFVGDTFTATVTTKVSGGGGTDGIIAYDLDDFPLVKSGIDFVGSAVQPVDNSVSAGTFNSTTGGLLGITGIYDGSGLGIGSTETLYTFQVHADAPGFNSVSTGLSVEPNGTGIPFILNASGDYIDPSGGGSPTFLVDTSAAVASFTVLPAAVPEPASALLLGGAIAAAGLRKFGRGSRRRLSA